MHSLSAGARLLNASSSIVHRACIMLIRNPSSGSYGFRLGDVNDVVESRGTGNLCSRDSQMLDLWKFEGVARSFVLTGFF